MEKNSEEKRVQHHFGPELPRLPEEGKKTIEENDGDRKKSAYHIYSSPRKGSYH